MAVASSAAPEASPAEKQPADCGASRKRARSASPSAARLASFHACVRHETSLLLFGMREEPLVFEDEVEPAETGTAFQLSRYEELHSPEPSTPREEERFDDAEQQPGTDPCDSWQHAAWFAEDFGDGCEDSSTSLNSTAGQDSTAPPLPLTRKRRKRKVAKEKASKAYALVDSTTERRPRRVWAIRAPVMDSLDPSFPTEMFEM
ncbi:hypothetical protein DFJ74DRAFT_643316 [Hyaloraphidium curvatum]|nr:hypothetical protein DFJ74DRAFT_643316 [Hyaloraphidium curvatum]